jgi:hypothetical protein
MFNFEKYKRKEHGLAVCAIGIGILLGVLLPPWGWMIACGIGLIMLGIYWFKRY